MNTKFVQRAIDANMTELERYKKRTMITRVKCTSQLQNLKRILNSCVV